jgi:hypothetical protein
MRNKAKGNSNIGRKRLQAWESGEGEDTVDITKKYIDEIG